MTTLKKVTEHMGLDRERISELVKTHSLNLAELTIDQARIELIGILRAGASGTTKREDIEHSTAKLLQAKRLKVTEQIKAINADMGKSKIVFQGYLIEDESTAELKRNLKEQQQRLDALQAAMGDENENDFTPESGADDGVNYYPCQIIHCPRINLSDDDYVKYIAGELDISNLKTGGINANAD